MKAILRRTIIGVTAAIAAPIGLPAAPPPQPDAELLRLGEELVRAWAEESAAWALVPDQEDEDGPLATRASALTAAVRRIVDRVQPLQATTLAGLLVKAKALSWCGYGQAPLTAEDLYWRADEPPVDRKILAGLLRDLTAMSTVTA